MIDEEKKRLLRLLDKAKSQIETLISVINKGVEGEKQNVRTK